MNILIAGTRKEGKSTLARYLARQFSDTVVMFDPQGTFRETSVEVSTPEELREVLEDETYIQRHNDHVYVYPISYHCDGDQELAFSDICKVLFPPHFSTLQGPDAGHLAFIVDEAWHLQGANRINADLKRVMAQAPPNNLMCIQCVHSLSQFNTITKSVMNQMFLFMQKGPRNRQVVEETCGVEVADLVCDHPGDRERDLAKFHCVRYWFDRRPPGLPYFEVWDRPELWYNPTGIADTSTGSESNASEKESEAQPL